MQRIVPRAVAAIVRLGAALVLAFAPLGCTTESDVDLAAPLVAGDEPCSDGEERACSEVLARHANVASCYRGSQRCVDGAWSECANGLIQSVEVPPRTKQVTSRSVPCQSNPCDPTCMRFQSDEGEFITDGGAPSFTPFDWQSGAVSNLGTGATQELLNEPCASGLDCQLNTRCLFPKTSAACEHNVCETGDGLLASCDGCVERICDVAPECCVDPTALPGLPSQCIHDPCEVGVSLDVECDACVTRVCDAMPECCTTEWSEACVDATSSICGNECVCGTGEVTRGDRCYFLQEPDLSWEDARDTCRDRGTGWDLAGVRNGQENVFLAGSVADDGFAWIGLNDEAGDGVWSWSGGDPAGTWGESGPPGQACTPSGIPAIVPVGSGSYARSGNDWNGAVELTEGINRALVVGVAAEGGNSNLTPTVTLGSTPMQLAETNTVGGSTRMGTSLFYLTESSLPAAGSHTLSVSFTSNVSFTVHVTQLTRVEDGPPEVTDSDDDGANGQNTQSLDVDVATSGAVLVDVAGTGQETSLSAGSDQTVTTMTVGSSMSGASSVREVDPARTVTNTWTAPGSNRLSISGAVFRPDAVPEPAASIRRESTAQFSGQNNSLQRTVTLPAALARAVVVGVVQERSDNTGPTGVTFAGTPMTLGVSNVVGSGNGYRATSHLYYLTESQLPAAGDHTLSVSFTGSPRYTVQAVFLSGVKDTVAEASASSNDSASGANRITTNVTTSSEGAWIVDLVGSGNQLSLRADSPQVVAVSDSPSSMAAAMSTLEVSSPGTVTMGWTAQGSNRLTHSLLAFAPIDEIPLPDPEIVIENVDEWGDRSTRADHGFALGGGPNRALVVAIAQRVSPPSAPRSVTFGGNALRLVEQTSVGSELHGSLYVATESELPPEGNHTLSVDFTGNSRHAIYAVELSGVAEGAPESTARNNRSGSNANLTTRITTQSQGALLVDMIATGRGSRSFSPTLVERLADLSSSGVSSAVGATTTTSPGNYDSGWTGSGSMDGLVQVVASLPRAPAPVLDLGPSKCFHVRSASTGQYLVAAEGGVSADGNAGSASTWQRVPTTTGVKWKHEGSGLYAQVVDGTLVATASASNAPVFTEQGCGGEAMAVGYRSSGAAPFWSVDSGGGAIFAGDSGGTSSCVGGASDAAERFVLEPVTCAGGPSCLPPGTLPGAPVGDFPTSWKPGQPDDPAQRCTLMDQGGSGLWLDQDCGQLHDSLCEGPPLTMTGAAVAAPDGGAWVPIPFRSTWSHFGDGDPGPTWVEPDFDDASWDTGVAHLGFGDGDEETVLTPGETSYYFRRRVDIPREVAAAAIDVVFDDGFIVYVNGREVVRRNADITSHDAWATGNVGRNDNYSRSIDPAAFVTGENVIAVVVKQSEGSSDLSFDLRLTTALCGTNGCSTGGRWTQSCVDLVATQCDATCDGSDPPSTAGVCKPWFPGETDATCNGIDLAVSMPCETNVPVCNHGTREAPAGITLVHFPADSDLVRNTSPDLSTPDAVTCVTSEPIAPGECIDVTGCPGLEDGREIMVNPPGPAEVAECSQLDNWALHDTGECNVPKCAGGVSVARLEKLPVDVIFIVDNSGSMQGEIKAIEEQINSQFSAIIEESGLDYRVVMMSRYGDVDSSVGNSNFPICIRSPLGGHDCSNPRVQPPANTERFKHYSADIDSHDALCRFVESFSKKDELTADARFWTPLAPGGLFDYLRPEAQKNIVVITDDNVDCRLPDGTLLRDNGSRDEGQVGLATDVATAFDNVLTTYAPGHFGTKDARRYAFHSIVALSEYTPVDAPWPANQPIQLGTCRPGAEAPGAGYQALSIATGGLRYPICRNSDFDAIFRAVAREVVAGAEISCSFDLDNEGAFDPAKTNVVITDGAGVTHVLPRVDFPSECSGAGEYYYEDADTVTLCPSACETVQGDIEAQLAVDVDCKPRSDGNTYSTYSVGTHTRSYFPSCGTDRGVQWGFLTYETDTPGNSRVEFSIRAGATLTELEAAEFTDPVIAQANPDTRVCRPGGPWPCVVDVYDLLGGSPAAHHPLIELKIDAIQGSDGSLPRVDFWDVSYSCLYNQ